MRGKRVFSILAVILFLATLGAAPAGDPAQLLREYHPAKFGKAKFVPDEILVKFKGDTRPFRRVKVPFGKVPEKIMEFLSRADIEFAEPNYYAHALWLPNDDLYPYQWHFYNLVYGGINLEEAWEYLGAPGTPGKDVIVAIVDTGVAYENYQESRWRRYEQAPDLAQTCFVAGYDFVNNDTHPNDDSNPGHGTHVAGTVAQSTNNAMGVAGIAFHACLMPVKVLDSTGSGTYADVADGIRWAADNGAHIINLSLGGSAPATTLEEAVAYAYNKGVTVIAASGNDGLNVANYPAAYDDYVIAIGATRYDETLSYYSNYGPSLDLVAPGGDLNVDQNGDGYGDGVLQQTYEKVGWFSISWGYYFMHGTSMAAPHVSGVAALLISHGNATTPDDIRTALQETAEDLGNPGRDDTYGWGLIDAAAALAWTSGPVDNPPTVSITNPADGETVSGDVTIEANAADDDGVERVEFYCDSTLIGTDYDSPYSTVWDSTGVSDGSHTIKATAFDTASQTTSDSINVTVDNINDPPIANAGPDQTVSDADGTGSEIVTLDGSGSFDPDGMISSYKWTEGAVVLGTAAVITYDFSVGTHNVTLEVTDDKGASATDNCTITVSANQAPTADAGPDQSGYVDDTINFDGSGSSDPDGNIVSYSWNFGDGNTGSGVTVSHVYSEAGTYTVTLTVTDNGGLTDQDTATVTISEAPSAPTAWLNIDLSKQTVWRWWRVTATVTVKENDASGSPIANATVYGTWSGAYNNSVSGTTDSSGRVSFRTGFIRNSETVTFTVTRIVKNGQEYVLTGETSDSIAGGTGR